MSGSRLRTKREYDKEGRSLSWPQPINKDNSLLHLLQSSSETRRLCLNRRKNSSAGLHLTLSQVSFTEHWLSHTFKLHIAWHQVRFYHISHLRGHKESRERQSSSVQLGGKQGMVGRYPPECSCHSSWENKWRRAPGTGVAERTWGGG